MTIAFDNKNNKWKSEYSFQTTCFSTVEDSFVSYRELTPFLNAFRTILYEHREDSVKNSWYESVQQPSTIGVSFNDNASNNKIFKTVSIEGGNINNQGGAVNLFFANSDNRVQKSSIIGPVTERGGIYYGTVGTTVVNSQSNVEVLGVVESYEQVDQNLLIRFNGSDSSSVSARSRFFLIDTSQEPYAAFRFLAGNWFVSTASNVMQTAYDSLPNNFSPIQSGDFSYQNGILVAGPTAFNMAVFNARIENGEIYIAHMTPSYVNGDQLRGQYAEAIFSIPANPSFEIYGFNLNYEPTDLDHSK